VRAKAPQLTASIVGWPFMTWIDYQSQGGW
jgi:hypothetical protein